MFSPTALALTGIGASIGCAGGTIFALSEKVGNKDSLIIKISKIAGIALLSGALIGSVTLGICALASTKGIVYVVTFIALLAIKATLSQR